MSALIPAIIDFIISRRRRGGRGGGGGGGGGGFDPEKYMRDYMTKQFLNEMDNLDRAYRQFGPGDTRSMIPQIRNNSSRAPRFTPVVPGYYQLGAPGKGKE